MNAVCPRLAAVALAAFAAGCQDAADRAAKQRVFSAESPPRMAHAATERLDPSVLASDPLLARRVLRMAAAEAAERLGPFKHEAEVSFEWRFGTKVVRLNEEYLLESGTQGDFHAKVDNDRKNGMEMVRAAGTVYGRSRWHKFRVRRRDRGHCELYREEAFAALRTFYDLVGGRLALADSGAATHLGRQAQRYAVSLAGRAPIVPEPDLPPIEYRRDGPPENAARRLRFAQQRSPTAVSGEIWIDAASAVPAKYDLAAIIVAPGEKGAEATLSLAAKGGLSALGDEVAVKAPKDPLPDDPRPGGIAAALARFGISVSPDGGVVVPPAEDEQNEEE